MLLICLYIYDFIYELEQKILITIELRAVFDHRHISFVDTINQRR